MTPQIVVFEPVRCACGAEAKIAKKAVGKVSFWHYCATCKKFLSICKRRQLRALFREIIASIPA